MITANDLMQIDRFLDQRGMVRMPGDTNELKDSLMRLRIKIAKELDKIQVKCVK